jgi:hypothetical protein
MNPRLLIVSSLTLAAFCAGVCPAAAANTLLDVRVGPHKRFDRVVFEFENEASSRVVLKNNQKVEVRFADVRLLDHFSVPALPRGLTVLRGIDAYREGESGLVFEILLARDATPTELPLAGRPWRLALDLAPRVSENPDEKPEYVPGDQPIPTKFAEAPLSASDTANTAQLRAVLAYFYLAQGDTRRALEQAALYQKIASTPLDLGFNRSAPQTAPTALPPPTRQPAWNRWRFSPTVLLMAALGVGFALGIIIRGFAPRVKISLQRTPRPARRRKEKTPRDLAEEIANDLDVLDDVVQQEPPRAPADALASPEAAEATLGSDAEKELRVTVKDRRVARVLELSREGRSISAIAEELQMGQDEVKLILDLKGQ